MSGFSDTNRIKYWAYPGADPRRLGRRRRRAAQRIAPLTGRRSRGLARSRCMRRNRLATEMTASRSADGRLRPRCSPRRASAPRPREPDRLRVKRPAAARAPDTTCQANPPAATAARIPCGRARRRWSTRRVAAGAYTIPRSGRRDRAGSPTRVAASRAVRTTGAPGRRVRGGDDRRGRRPRDSDMAPINALPLTHFLRLQLRVHDRRQRPGRRPVPAPRRRAHACGPR